MQIRLNTKKDEAVAKSIRSIKTLKDVSVLDFSEHAKLLEALQKQAEASPRTAPSLLPYFYRLLEGQGTSSDMLPTAAQTFAAITKGLSPLQITEVIDTLHKQNKDCLIEKASMICRENPKCATPIFNFMATRIKQTPYSDDTKNFLVPAVNNLANVLLCAIDEELPAMLKRIGSLEPKVQDLFASSYGRLYKHKPYLRDFIWYKISKEAANTTDFNRLYRNLEAVVDTDGARLPGCLQLIRSKITDPKQDSFDLKTAYKVLGKIRSMYPLPEKVDAVIIRGLQNPQNSTSSKKAAYRQLGRIEELISHSSLGQRVEKTDDNPYGFKIVDHIPNDETAVLFLGGNITNSEKNANGYLSSLEDLLQKNNLKGKVAIYAAIYDFGESEDKEIVFNDYLARAKLKQDYHRRAKISRPLNEDTLHPHYIDDLFDKTLLHRITGKNGKRLSAEEACAQIRKLTIASHCHGAYTFLKLEEKMQRKMQELGYSAEEQSKIQHELLCITHAPDAPLGISKSTMISFVSAQDWDIYHYNNFETSIREMSKNDEVLFSYFPSKQGEMFLTPSLGEEISQHNFAGYDTTQKGLSKEGRALLGLAGNAIVNSIKSSLKNLPLPTVKGLVCGQDERVAKLFDKLQENGEKMWAKITFNTVLRLKVNKGKGKSDG